MLQSSSEFELGDVYPGTGGRSGYEPMMWDVNRDLKDSRDGAQVTLRGRMFHSFGPVTANDESYILTLRRQELSWEEEGLGIVLQDVCAHRTLC